MRSETYSTPGPLRLNLEIPAGEIQVETGNTDETHVELEAVAKNDSVRDLVESSRIELVRRGDGAMRIESAALRVASNSPGRTRRNDTGVVPGCRRNRSWSRASTFSSGAIESATLPATRAVW